MMRRPTPLVLCLALAAGCGGVKATGGKDTVGTSGRRSAIGTNVQQIVQSGNSPDYVTRDPEGARLWKQTRSFYEKRNFEPAWIDEGSPRG